MAKSTLINIQCVGMKNKANNNSDTCTSSGVSVVVCCHNSASVLAQTLEHLGSQDVPVGLPWEVIVVDNASTDETGSIASKIWCELGEPTKLRVVEERTLGLSAARRCGTMSAKYATLIFCDDDNWLDSDYVSIAATLMEDESIGIAGGIGRAVSTIELPEWFESVQRSYAVGPPTKNPPGVSNTYLFGAGMVLRTDTLKQAYELGFEPLLSDRKGNKLYSGGDGEIAEWCHIIDGKNWFYSDKLQFQHFILPNRLTKGYLTKLKRGFGKMRAVMRLYRVTRTDNLGGITERWSWAIIRAILAMPLVLFRGYKSGQLKNTIIFQLEHFNWLLQDRERYYRAFNSIRQMYKSIDRAD